MNDIVIEAITLFGNNDNTNTIYIVKAYLEVNVDDGVNLCKSGTMAGFAKVDVVLIGYCPFAAYRAKALLPVFL